MFYIFVHIFQFLLVFIASEVSSEVLTKVSSNVAPKALPVELSKASSLTSSEAPTETSSEASHEASSEASPEESSEASSGASSESSTEESSEASTGKGASSEEASLPNELADAIYEHQKVCDAFVGEAVVNAVEKGTNEMPKPDEKYRTCMKKLDKHKREYITYFLVGINYQSKGFPMRLSNEKEVTLPFPSEESPLEGSQLEYDIQQQLCMTNLLCKTISTKINIDNVGDLEEQKMYVERCLDFLSFLKLKYIDVNKQEKNEFEKEKSLTIICGDGEVTLPLPLRTEGNKNPPPSSLTPEKTPDSGSSVGKIKEEQAKPTETSAFVLADAIFDKQKECDSYINETVSKAVETNISKFPVPDEKYVQCVKTLSEYKREYIKHFLLGLNYYSKMFPIVLFNRKLVTLPVPADRGLSTDEDSDFDIQQELCVTNKLCLTLVSKRFSNLEAEDLNDQKLRVVRCLDFLNDLKLKYIKVKHIDESELKKGQGLSLMCTYGEITLALPEKKDHAIFSDTPVSRVSKKILKRKDLFITKKNEHLIKGNSVGTDSSSKDSNIDGKKEIRYKFDKLSKKIITVTLDSHKEVHNIETPERQHENGEHMFQSKTEETAEEKEDKPMEKPRSPTALEETETLHDKNNDVEINVPAITKTVPEINIPQGEGSENVQLLNDHIKVLSNDSNSNNLPIQANKKVMETEFVNTTKEQGFGLIDEGKISRQIKSLGDNIILIEKDCQELLEFGERLLQSKILSSLMNLETQYHECVKKLDTLKKMYIEKQKLDVTSHKHFFPLTLSTGESKLVSLPAQFLRLGLEEPQPSSNLIPDDVFELADFSRKSSRSGNSIKTREPFDNPAFITNEKFLKSLQEEFAAEGISTLSKLASALHISSNYKDEKIAE